MLLRPIDAIFVHPEKRFYVVYFRGELWQLPRMKIDHSAWQRRQPYDGDTKALYLSRQQAISDPILAQKLRTLNLPMTIRGSTLPRFEAWWEVHGFEWLRGLLNEGKSPLAAQQSRSNIAALDTSSANSAMKNMTDNGGQVETRDGSLAETDVFDTMLATLTDEVRHHRH